MLHIGCELGGQKETFFGLSGSGDLMATCFGDWSRNRSFGESIVKNKDSFELMCEQKTVVEGYNTVKCLYEMLESKALNYPILNELYSILYQAKPVKESIDSLMNRHLKSE